MHCITPLTPSAYLVHLHNRTLIVIKFVLINTHAEAKFTQGNSALLQYSSGAQRPARGPHPARDEFWCGPRPSTRKATISEPELTLSLQWMAKVAHLTD